ncbi:MAG: type IV pilin protein [Xanthomonadales bacterium]|nr:type IV pilin protein [Xanthomonadales bacterium]
MKLSRNMGFTLIELLVVIAIIALLMAYALPNYRQYVIESKRTDAHSRLLEIANMYEKFYTNNNAYPANLAALGISPTFFITEDYQITVAAAGGGWTLTATAINGQVEDTACPAITFNNLGQKGPANSECWND